MATFAPSRAKRIAMAWPIPEDAPVIRTFLSCNLNIRLCSNLNPQSVSQTGGGYKTSNAGSDPALQSEFLFDEKSASAAITQVVENPHSRFRCELAIDEGIGQIQNCAAREH